MSTTVTLNHVRYGRCRFDLAELKRRLEQRIAEGARGAKLGQLLVHTNRLLAMLEAQEAGRDAHNLKKAIEAEFAILLLGFEQVQAIMEGRSETPKRRRKPRALPKPKRKPPA